jgi:hypothetical protein
VLESPGKCGSSQVLGALGEHVPRFTLGQPGSDGREAQGPDQPAGRYRPTHVVTGIHIRTRIRVIWPGYVSGPGYVVRAAIANRPAGVVTQIADSYWVSTP